MDDMRWPRLLQTLLALPHETEWVEFKRDNSKPEEIGEYLSALSNSASLHQKPKAYLVWGVEDGTHAVVGTQFRPRQRKVGNEELENWLLRGLEPRIDVTIQEFDVADKRVALFEIQPCGHQPVRWQGAAFIRVGSYKKKLNDYPEKERALWLRSAQIEFEKAVAAPDVLSEEALAMVDYPAYFEMTGQPLPTTRDSILSHLEQERMVVRRSIDRWDVSNLGALLFARKLADFPAVSRKAVRVIVYEGKGRTQAIKEHVGPQGYAAGFDELVRYINDQLPANEEVGIALRREVRMYPEIAIRELVANAIVHQDLLMRGVSPTVEIFADRVEITNPGPPLIDPLRFIDGPPRSRNEHMAGFLRRLRICEERGSGIDKVIASIELFQLPAPDFRDTDSHTITTLFAARKLTEMSRSDKVRACYQHACLRHVSGEVMTNATLRKRFGIKDQNYTAASKIISDTIQAGRIKVKDPESTSRKLASYVPIWA